MHENHQWCYTKLCLTIYSSNVHNCDVTFFLSVSMFHFKQRYWIQLHVERQLLLTLKQKLKKKTTLFLHFSWRAFNVTSKFTIWWNVLSQNLPSSTSMLFSSLLTHQRVQSFQTTVHTLIYYILPGNTAYVDQLQPTQPNISSFLDGKYMLKRSSECFA